MALQALSKESNYRMWKHADGWKRLHSRRAFASCGACLGIRTRVRTPPPVVEDTAQKPIISSALLCSFEQPAEDRRSKVVVEISLPGNDMGKAGALPHVAIGRLRHLTKLELPNNAFHGPLVEMMPLSCSKLEHLILSSNRFCGPVPSQLASYPRLVEVRLANNDFVGPLPALARLKSLEILDLHNNRLTGQALPPDLVAGCSQLRELRLGANRFDVLEVPLKHPRLRRLELHTNRLVGELSSTIANLTGLTYLDLCQNGLTGSMPVDALAQLPLKALSLNRNSFTAPRVQGAQLQSRFGSACAVYVDAVQRFPDNDSKSSM